MGFAALEAPNGNGTPRRDAHPNVAAAMHAGSIRPSAWRVLGGSIANPWRSRPDELSKCVSTVNFY